MKISQAVNLLAISTSGEKVVLDRTRQFDIAPTEDGVRSGIFSMKLPCNRPADKYLSQLTQLLKLIKSVSLSTQLND